MATNQKLKIGLDYHGVVDQHLQYFAQFCQIAKLREHQIHIITGGPKADVEEYLRNNQIPYDSVFAILDYYQGLGKTEQGSDGKLTVPDHLWNIAKAKYCRHNHIDFHIDDSIKYLHWFTTPFCLYSKQQNKCYLSPDIELDFNKAPNVVLADLEQISTNLNTISR